jgi:putative transposase
MAHRKTIRHYHEPGHLHEFTFSCYGRRPLLTNDDWREKLARSLDEAGEAEGMQLVAFVFMPEHVHLLVYPTRAQPNFGRYLALIKQPFSKQVKAVLEARGSRLLQQLTVQERPGKFCFRFWQEGPGYDRNLFTPEAIAGFIDYVHQNPVKRGLCLKAIDWKWSSARYYLSDPPRQIVPGLPFLHGLPPGVFD